MSKRDLLEGDASRENVAESTEKNVKGKKQKMAVEETVPTSAMAQA